MKRLLSFMLFVALASSAAQTVSSVSQASVGKQITIRGKFSLRGVIGPYVVLSDQQVVYLASKGSFTWGKKYSDMEGRQVEATGTLKFFHFPDSKAVDDAVARPVDHFYFEVENTQVRLIKMASK